LQVRVDHVDPTPRQKRFDDEKHGSKATAIATSAVIQRSVVTATSNPTAQEKKTVYLKAVII